LDDVVHDMEYTKHLIEEADEFLSDNPSQSSSDSKASFIRANKERAF